MKRHALSICLQVAALLAALPLAAQPPDFKLPVSYTEAIEYDVRESLELTGSVASYRSSVVASEIAGLVVELEARDGQKVARGAALARLRRETAALRLASVEGQLTEAQARLKLAEGRRGRAQRMWDERVISRQELDDALTEVEAGAGRVSQLEAEVARLKDELERTTIRAPFAGVVVAEHTAVGEWIAAGGPVVELVDVGDLEVTLEVPEAFYRGLRVGEEVEVTIAALPGLEIVGKVRSVVPRADSQARTFPVKIAISNEDTKIGVGMLASVRIPIGASATRVLVPKDAVLTQGSRRSLFLVGDEDEAVPMQVRTGSSHGDWIVVEGEIRAGTRVVTQGNERLQPGMKLDAKLKEFPRP